MKNRVNLLLIANKKRRSAEVENTKRLFEEYAPGLYNIFHLVGTEDVVNQIIDLKPGIIVLNDDVNNSLELTKQIKQILPNTAIFIFMLSIVDDEQEAIDEYMSSGAYKCYLPPIVMDTMIHDMYVSLNLE